LFDVNAPLAEHLFRDIFGVSRLPELPRPGARVTRGDHRG
jgi:hypothetical protein